VTEESFGLQSENGAVKQAEPAPAFNPFEKRPHIYAIKTQMGQEKKVSDSIWSRVKRMHDEVLSVLAPQELKGYVLVEAYDPLVVENMIKGVTYTRSMVTGEIPFEQIEHFLTPTSAVANISEGDIVELISGPFRGEKAKVTRIDEGKEEITVELFEAMVPIPITVRGEHARVIKKEGE